MNETISIPAGTAMVRADNVMAMTHLTRTRPGASGMTESVTGHTLCGLKNGIWLENSDAARCPKCFGYA